MPLACTRSSSPPPTADVCTMRHDGNDEERRHRDDREGRVEPVARADPGGRATRRSRARARRARPPRPRCGSPPRSTSEPGARARRPRRPRRRGVARAETVRRAHGGLSLSMTRGRRPRGAFLRTSSSAVHERAELIVGRVEVRAHPQAAARPVVVEEAAADELARDDVRPREVEADGAPARGVVPGRVHREAASLDELAQEPRLPQGLRADALDAEARERLPARPAPCTSRAPASCRQSSATRPSRSAWAPCRRRTARRGRTTRSPSARASRRGPAARRGTPRPDRRTPT